MAEDHVIHNEAQAGSVGSNAFLDQRQDDAAVAAVESVDTLGDYEALIYAHPDYVAWSEKWRKFEDCYEAEDIYRFVHRHPRESQDMFDVRLKRGYYYNYCAAVVDLMVAYLFHAPIERLPGSAAEEEFERLYADADLRGTTYVNLLQDVAAFAQIHGHCGVLVDAPSVEGLESEEQREALGVRPYLTVVRAPQIRDWELDQYGKFEWVKIEVVRDAVRSFRKEVPANLRYFVIWTKQSWELWQADEGEEEARRIDEGENPLGVVPLVIIYNERAKNHRWFGSSQLRDIADINIAILNWSSLGDEEIAERCLNILTMEESGNDMPEVLAHHNVLEYRTGTQPPSYLVPGDTPLKLIGEWIDRGKDEIFRLSKLSGSTGLLGVREATSGIAYAYEFNETNQSLGKKAEGLEQGETEIHRLVAKWVKAEWDGKVAYPREFGVDDFLMEFQVLTGARTNLTSETAIKEVEKRVTSKMFARHPMKLRKTIEGEIEQANPILVGMAESFQKLPAGLTNPSSGQPGSGEAADED